jgi:hypothetical protein
VVAGEGAAHAEEDQDGDVAGELGGGRGSHGGGSGSWRHRRGWGIIFGLSYNLIVGFVACLVRGGKGLF